MKENFEYTAEMGFENWDVGILGFGRDRTKRKIREYVRKRR